jgi:hypothetical protein
MQGRAAQHQSTYLFSPLEQVHPDADPGITVEGEGSDVGREDWDHGKGQGWFLQVGHEAGQH